MLSVVLYGRNDSYGYNLHKRAALGINCMAEILTDPDDEILFVDYNTPDDYPTFPEAIADTLTARARARMRVLRVRPSVHDRFTHRTHLHALEPIARNVAVRRSNPRNRWMLSTNTDMIFVPRSGRSLSDIAAGLDAGFYHLPRFELPESLWEGFDRSDPAGVIDQVRELGRSMFLNEIVYGSPIIKYDAPGDFQLMRREDLFDIHGFDEEMLLGWHVDSNIAKRLYLLHGAVGDVVADLFGYHCDHTRQVTPAHRHRAPSNDSRAFVDDVTEARLPRQAGVWGCAHDDIEEIRPGGAGHHVYVASLRSALQGEWTEPSVARDDTASCGAVTYDARHVLPFLADLFVSAPRGWNVGWMGGRSDTFQLFCSVWRSLGFSGSILVHDWSAPLLLPGASGVAKVADAGALAEAADVLVFDFGLPSGGASPAGDGGPGALDTAVDLLLRRSFARLVRAERTRLARGAVPRRFVCINAIRNAYEGMACEEIVTAATPFATRLRHGFVKPESDHYGEPGPAAAAQAAPNLLDVMQLGDAGRRVPGAVRAPFGRRGVVMHGPHRLLPPGVYRLDVTMNAKGVRSLASAIRPVILDVSAGAARLLRRRIRVVGTVTAGITFELSDARARDPVYCCLVCGRSVDLFVTGITLTRVVAPGPDEEAVLARLIAEVARHGGAETVRS